MNAYAEGDTGVFTNCRIKTQTGAPTILRTGFASIKIVPDADYTVVAADLVNNGNFVNTTASAGRAFNLPTAAQIVAAIPNCHTGDSFQVRLLNQSTQTWTVTAGANTTLRGTAAVATLTVGTIRVTILNSTAASEKVCVSVG